VCSSDLEREISASAYNRLRLPDISRQDAALEPIPGVPSLVPVLRAEEYYGVDRPFKLRWNLDLPRVEFLNPMKCGVITCSTDWNKQIVYVYMPWGKEEYSIEAEKKCFGSNNEPVACETSEGYFNSRYVHNLRITYYPAPGQNLFSYIVLETTAPSYYFTSMGPNASEQWKVTRYGDDGSVTEFERNYGRRPDAYRFMDYIPISKHITRDQKETLFKYEWERNNRYSYYKMKSVSVIDPLKRVIKIESDSTDSGLTGRPDPEHKVLYEPLDGNVEIFAGKVDEEDNPVEPLTKIVKYSFSDDFEMTAEIYENGAGYRVDRYYISSGTLFLESYNYNSVVLPNHAGALNGKTMWDLYASGYTEKKLVANSKPEEYIVKTVSGSFVSAYQFHYPVRYSLSSSRQRAKTVYGTEKNGVRVNERIVEDYFTNWAQPAKRVTCKPANDNDEDCTDNATSVTEEIKYNVSGSPIYFKNADGQVTVNLYETGAETNAENYNFHFYADPHTYNNYDQTIPDLNLGFVRADNLRRTGNVACSLVYSLDTQDNFDQIPESYIPKQSIVREFIGGSSFKY